MSRAIWSVTLATALLLGPSLTAWAEEVDHAALAAQYEQEAKEAHAKVQMHEEMEKRYGGVQYQKVNNVASMKNHCRRLIAKYKEVAADAEALAEEHRADAAKKQ